MIAVSVSGADTVARGLDTLTARLGDLSPAYAELGVAMEDAATPLVPVLTSRLVDDLKADPDAEGLDYGSDLEYAGVQAGGWREHNIEPHGFLDAAYQVAEQRGPATVEDMLTRTAAAAGLI